MGGGKITGHLTSHLGRSVEPLGLTLTFPSRHHHDHTRPPFVDSPSHLFS